MKRMIAAEALTSGFCPLNCKYCYIPKTKEMKRLHNEIVSGMDKTFVDIKKTYKNLEYISFWGTEPLLTLDRIKNLEGFPNLKEISFSTSMMGRTEPFVDFIKRFGNWNGDLKVQISLDGPAFITDKNRVKGASEIIPKNLFNILRKLNRMKLSMKVKFRWKVTLQPENMEEMNASENLVDSFWQYFLRLNNKFDAVNKNQSVSLEKGSFCPTLMVPGKYTSKDGRAFAKFLSNLHKKGYSSSYDYRFRRIMDFFDELHKRSMFTCSGGDSNFAVGLGNLHICHRTFYFEDERYVESVLKSGVGNWDVSKFEKGTVDHIKQYYIVPTSNEKEKTRFYYTMRGHHDFWRAGLAYVNAMMIELSKVGQVLECYKSNEELRNLFALFVNVGSDCPMENLLNTGTIHFTPVSILRMFGNGAFREIVKEQI